MDDAPWKPWKTREWSKYYKEFLPASATPYLTASTGMWHQFGNQLKTSLKGYHLRIEDEGDLGLATAVGFLKSDPSTTATVEEPTALGYLDNISRSKKSLSVKLGKIATKKQIKEAVKDLLVYLSYGKVLLRLLLLFASLLQSFQV